MALQSNALMLLGQGLQGEAANGLQPAIDDGIHLRWSFDPDRGFPRYGFYLFRRQRQYVTDTRTLGNIIQEQGWQPPSRLDLTQALNSGAFGSLSSNVSLRIGFLDVSPGFDLSNRQFLELSFRVIVCTAQFQLNFSTSGSVTITAKDGDVTVATTTASATGRSTFYASIKADRITSVEFSSGPALVLDCTVCTVQTRAATGANQSPWQKLPGFTYPLMLPITHPNHPLPSTTGAESYSFSRTAGLGRVLYNKSKWPNTTPTVLTSAGVVALTQNSPLVVGTGTSWSQALIGETFTTAGHNSVYMVAQVVDSTHLVLSRAYTGSTLSGRTYSITRDNFGQLYNYLHPLVSGGPSSSMADISLPAEASPRAAATIARGSTTLNGSGTAWDNKLVGLTLYMGISGGGSVTLYQGSYSVRGTGTAWDERMVGRLFQPSTTMGLYVIKEVVNRDLLVLDRPYTGASGDASYTLIESSPYRIASFTSATQLQIDQPYQGSFTSGWAYFFPNQQASAGEQAASMDRQYLLDYLLLSSLDPAIAQMLGLYWVDKDAAQPLAFTAAAVNPDPFGTYDYLLVADYTNVANRSVDAMLALVQTGNWSQVEACITIDQHFGAAPALTPPSQPSAYVLPGPVVNAPGNVGLRWNIEQTPTGRLLPGRPIFYHLWRAPLPTSAPTSPPALPAPSAYQVLTQNRPILVVENESTSGPPVERPPDWPPYQLYAFDRKLAEGWYSYAVSAVDIFGRHSARTTASWMQWLWNPPAELGLTKPWYFNGASSEHPVNSTNSHAVCILSKVVPPVPAAVEAFLLDPADPYVLKDPTYTTWRAANPSALGLRVRWQWTQRQASQAPDTSEFRIYYHSGANPPARVAGQHSVYPWQYRLHAQPYAGLKEQFTVGSGAESIWVRAYDVILTLSDPLPSPDSRTPILYAHIGVTAADSRTHTADGYTRTGRISKTNPAARTGNESAVSSPAKVFRVRRGNTDTVAVPPEGDAVYATPADYYGVSRYTYRWTPPTLGAGEKRFVQVFRALDETVFMVDWARRQAAVARNQGTAIAASSLELFPPEWRGSDAAAKRTAIADKLNYLDPRARTTAEAFVHYRGLAGPSNDTLRVLAGLPGNERAFTLLTTKAVPASQGAYEDTLDGRADSRYFYRARFLDAANNPGPFTHASPPVWMPDVQPPRAPAITKALGGDRQITLVWASNREPDLKEYRIYRADSGDSARDLRLMTLVQTVGVPAGDPTTRPAEASWVDSGVPGLVNRYYRVVAVDTTLNSSEPSAVVCARAFDETPPTPPALTVVWTDATPAAARASWTATEESLLERRSLETVVWDRVTDWLTPGAHTIDDTVSSDYTWLYRIRVRKGTGALAIGSTTTLRRRI
jgi:hypothetical protein